jgi:Leucine-rich repeat (LRR) protein
VVNNITTRHSIENLTTLDASNANISNTSGINYLTNLINLNLQNNHIKDIDLSKLTSLTTLHII